MGLFLCVNDRKQTLGDYLGFPSASSGQKEPILIGHIFTILNPVCVCVCVCVCLCVCMSEGGTDIHQPMYKIIGRKKSEFYLLCLGYTCSVLGAWVHCGLRVNVGPLRVVAVSFVLP